MIGNQDILFRLEYLMKEWQGKYIHGCYHEIHSSRYGCTYLRRRGYNFSLVVY